MDPNDLLVLRICAGIAVVSAVSTGTFMAVKNYEELGPTAALMGGTAGFIAGLLFSMAVEALLLGVFYLAKFAITGA